MQRKVFKSADEWMKQSDYDFETAKAMFKAGRYIYTVFMCHLSVEKALKGLYVSLLKKDPPKTHDLVYLAGTANIVLSPELRVFIEDLNDLSVPTRYPEELDDLLKQYKKEKTKKTLNDTQEVLSWAKKRF